jgi:hypothetical protein
MPVDTITYTSHGPANNRKIVYDITMLNSNEFKYVIRTTDAGFDADAFISRLTNKINERVKAHEVERWLEDTEALIAPDEAATPRYLSTWRAAYKDGVKEEHQRLGYKMTREVNAATVTPAQMNTAWGMDDAERIAFLGRVEIAHDKWVDTQDDVGE